MILNFKTKKIIVKKINDLSNKAIAITIANIHNVTTNEINSLRKQSHININNINFMISKNTLLSLGLKNTKFSYINKKFLKGHILVGYSFYDPTIIFKLLNDLYNNNNNFIIKCIALDNKLYTTSDEIKSIIILPSYKQSLRKFIFILKITIIGRLLLILNTIIKKNVP